MEAWIHGLRLMESTRDSSDVSLEMTDWRLNTRASTELSTQDSHDLSLQTRE